MTRPEPSVIDTVVELLQENGLLQMAEVIRILLNEAMRLERSQVLEAEPYQRSEMPMATSRKRWPRGWGI